MKCPNCGFDCPPEMLYCGMCGIALTSPCPTCQYNNPVTYKYCGMCGSSLPQANVINQPVAAAPTRPLPVTNGKPVGASSPPTPKAIAEPVTTPLSGQRRVATVMFADVKDSTKLLETLGTETWVEVMNNVFQILETEIYKYGGEVGQFRGDGLVAFFGANVAHEDDPERAVLCGLAIQDALTPFTARLLKTADVQLTIRIGINTGEVIIANLGDNQYGEATPMGEALTIASRMEAAAEPGTVLVSEYTYRLVRDQFEWTSLGEYSVKGLTHAVSVYRPISIRKSMEIGQDIQSYGFAHWIIGRKDEQQLLKQTIEGLYAGKGGICLVTGVKGMGKSFLVNHIREHFERQNILFAAAHSKEMSRKADQSEGIAVNKPIRWLHGRCRSYGHLRPYSMWLDLFQEWLSSHPQEDFLKVQNILQKQVEQKLDTDVEKDYPNLSGFLSLPSEQLTNERIKHLDAESTKRQFFQAVRDWIEKFAQKNPLVISFTDMQWADSTSLELLNYCLPLCDKESVLWLLVYRRERESAIWEFEHTLETIFPHRVTQLALQPLSKDGSLEFLDEFLGKGALFEDTRDLIIKRSEGNPYFIKEMVHVLISQSALVKDESTQSWKQTKPVKSIDLPDSLQSILTARIDRLSQNERRILQMAAVIGSVFWLNVIQALISNTRSPQQLKNDLVELQRAGLIHERALVEDLGMEYAFDSSLIQEVAYESLLHSQRVTYHSQIAEFLEEIVFREGKPRYFDTLSHHYRLAGNIKKELFYTLQAAERAQSIYANVEALHYFSRALELLDNMEVQSINGSQKYAISTQKFEALNGRRAVNFLMGNVESGWQDAKALLPLARQMSQDPTWLIDALLQQPGVFSADNREELLEGIPLAQEALDLAIQIGDKRREMNCLLAIASQKNLMNDPDWIATGDRAVSLAREIGDKQYEAMVLLGLGHAYVGRDELEKGMEYLNAAMPICQELDDRVSEMTLLRVMGAQYERTGDYYLRLVKYEQKRLQIARDIGDRFEEANSLMFCGQIQALNLGDFEGGLALIQESATILEAVSGKIFPLLRTAQVQICLGQYEDAQRTLLSAKPVAEQSVYDLGRVGWKIVTILLYISLGDSVQLQRALEICDEIAQMDNRKLISRQYRMAAACEAAHAHLNLARLSSTEQERLRQNQLALEESRKAVEVYNSFKYINIIECAYEEILLRHSQALTANGYQKEAAEALEQAYNEMMRKYELIPQESHFRRTYLENISYHREIRAAHTATELK